MAIKGKKQTSEHIAKRIASLKAGDYYGSEKHREVCAKVGKALLGRKLTDKIRKKISKTMRVNATL